MDIKSWNIKGSQLFIFSASLGAKHQQKNSAEKWYFQLCCGAQSCEIIIGTTDSDTITTSSFHSHLKIKIKKNNESPMCVYIIIYLIKISYMCVYIYTLYNCIINIYKCVTFTHINLFPNCIYNRRNKSRTNEVYLKITIKFI